MPWKVDFSMIFPCQIGQFQAAALKSLHSMLNSAIMESWRDWACTLLYVKNKLQCLYKSDKYYMYSWYNTCHKLVSNLQVPKQSDLTWLGAQTTKLSFTALGIQMFQIRKNLYRLRFICYQIPLLSNLHPFHRVFLPGICEPVAVCQISAVPITVHSWFDFD